MGEKPIEVSMDELPQMVQQAEEQFMEYDRAFFEKHPKRTNFVRTVFPGEFPQLPHEFVHVVQLQPGFRVRAPIATRTEVSDRARVEGMSVRDYMQRRVDQASGVEFESKAQALSFMAGHREN